MKDRLYLALMYAMFYSIAANTMCIIPIHNPSQTAARQLIAALYGSAAEGNPQAQFELGLCYDHGIGVERNLETAAYWYRRVAEQGNVVFTAALERLENSYRG